MNSGRILVGSILVLLGALFALDAMGVLSAGQIIGAWWPLAPLAAAILMYATNPRHWVVPVVIGVVSVSLLLTTTGVVEQDLWDLMWPLILIIVGIGFLAGRRPRGQAAEDADRVQAFVVFSGSELASRSSRFSGGSISALFGGVELDLRDAAIEESASLDVLALFGGAEIRVPVGWNVVLHGTPVFGGFENATAGERLPPDAPRLDVNATVGFGAVEVKH